MLLVLMKEFGSKLIELITLMKEFYSKLIEFIITCSDHMINKKKGAETLKTKIEM